MTEKQIEKLRLKIKKIKSTLASEKRKFGTYDDSRGLRYMPTQYYIKLNDWSEGLKYVKWFQKNFPDDCGFPDFLFESSIIIFKSGQLQLAEKKVFETFCSNTYVIDKYFERPIIPIDKLENSNIDIPEFTKFFNYSFKQAELNDYSEWLDQLIKSDKFETTSKKFIEIHKRLKTEDDRETRGYLIKQASQLEEEY